MCNFRLVNLTTGQEGEEFGTNFKDFITSTFVKILGF